MKALTSGFSVCAYIVRTHTGVAYVERRTAEENVRNCASAPGCGAIIASLGLIACCAGAMAQGTPPPAVTIVPVESREVTNTGEFVGRVVAIDKVDIVARVPGFIEERYFTEGQEVKKGDLLFRIEQATYKALVEQQEAAVAKAKATEANAVLQLDRGK